jgi:hypothetical protein
MVSKANGEKYIHCNITQVKIREELCGKKQEPVDCGESVEAV